MNSDSNRQYTIVVVVTLDVRFSHMYPDEVSIMNICCPFSFSFPPPIQDSYW